MNPSEIVRAFWQSMGENDFDAAARRWLSPDYLGLWPQTGEVIRGPEAYARVNNAFPGHGDWRFEELRLIGQDMQVVTDMRISNAELQVAIHAITFHEIADGLIRRQTEYWPDAYEVPGWRAGVLEQDREVARW